MIKITQIVEGVDPGDHHPLAEFVEECNDFNLGAKLYNYIDHIVIRSDLNYTIYKQAKSLNFFGVVTTKEGLGDFYPIETVVAWRIGDTLIVPSEWVMI